MALQAVPPPICQPCQFCEPANQPCMPFHPSNPQRSGHEGSPQGQQPSRFPHDGRWQDGVQAEGWQDGVQADGWEVVTWKGRKGRWSGDGQGGRGTGRWSGEGKVGRGTGRWSGDEKGKGGRRGRERPTPTPGRWKGDGKGKGGKGKGGRGGGRGRLTPTPTPLANNGLAAGRITRLRDGGQPLLNRQNVGGGPSPATEANQVEARETTNQINNGVPYGPRGEVGSDPRPPYICPLRPTQILPM